MNIKTLSIFTLSIIGIASLVFIVGHKYNTNPKNAQTVESQISNTEVKERPSSIAPSVSEIQESRTLEITETKRPALTEQELKEHQKSSDEYQQELTALVLKTKELNKETERKFATAKPNTSE